MIKANLIVRTVEAASLPLDELILFNEQAASTDGAVKESFPAAWSFSYSSYFVSRQKKRQNNFYDHLLDIYYSNGSWSIRCSYR